MARSRLLVFGTSGQLAQELRLAAAPFFDLIALSRTDTDFAESDAPARALARHPDIDIVVNATGYTAVDKAESEEARARTINVDAVGALALACRTRGLPLVHVSTDYVFDGTATDAYREDDPVGPLSVYGRTKLAGENAIRAVLDHHVIVRASWVYSPFGNNFVKTMLRLGVERHALNVVDDQRGCPTAASDLAGAMLTIAGRIRADAPVWGTFHYCGSGVTSWCKFAEEIFHQALSLGWPVKAQVVPIPTSAYPTPAHRPRNSVLDCSKITEAYGVTPRPWREALGHVLARLKEMGT